MIEIDFEAYFSRLKFAKRGGRNCVFDPVRRKYVAAEKEELVRQVLLLYFTDGLHYPKVKMAVEKMIQVNGLKRRFDIMIYGPLMEPFMLVECKSPDVRVGKEVFRQIANYNLPLQVPFLMVSNGLESYCCKMDYEKEDFLFLEEMPGYPGKIGESSSE